MKLTIDGVKGTFVPDKVEQELFNDWRVPNIKELTTLIDYERFKPATKVSDTKSESYWSSTNRKGNSTNAWIVHFINGYVYNSSKNDSLYVRCVRGREDGLEWSESSKCTMSWREAFKYAKELEAPVYYREKENKCRK